MPSYQGEAYLWPLQTKYFAASLWVLVVEDDEDTHSDLTSLSTKCGALIILFDASAPQSWDGMSVAWGADLLNESAEILLVVGEVRRPPSTPRVHTLTSRSIARGETRGLSITSAGCARGSHSGRKRSVRVRSSVTWIATPHPSYALHALRAATRAVTAILHSREWSGVWIVLLNSCG